MSSDAVRVDTVRTAAWILPAWFSTDDFVEEAGVVVVAEIAQSAPIAGLVQLGNLLRRQVLAPLPLNVGRDRVLTVVT